MSRNYDRRVFMDEHCVQSIFGDVPFVDTPDGPMPDGPPIFHALGTFQLKLKDGREAKAENYKFYIPGATVTEAFANLTAAYHEAGKRCLDDAEKSIAEKEAAAFRQTLLNNAAAGVDLRQHRKNGHR